MASKNSFKSKFVWFCIFIMATLVLTIIIVPPMINLNFLKPKIENMILNQTGISAQINGNINFTLLGKTTIIARDIVIPNGTVASCKFAIPFWDIFDLKNAHMSSDISVSGASLFITRLNQFNTRNTITVHNSNIRFLNKEYTIIDGTLSRHDINAIVRTNQHKYDVKSHNNMFTIKNKNNDLNISGKLFKDGTATAHIEINAKDINRWFEFEKPQVSDLRIYLLMG